MHNPRKYNTKELLGLILISKMSDLIVKDNALMNASYNLDLVEQRLILFGYPLRLENQAKESMPMIL